MGRSLLLPSLVLLAAAALRQGWTLDCQQQPTTVCNWWGCVDTATLAATACAGTEICLEHRSYDASGDPKVYGTQTGCADTTSTGYSCSFSSAAHVTCDKYCPTADCNNVYTADTGTTNAISCVQCTGEESSDACYSSPPGATTCPSTGHQYCTTLHTAVLDADGNKERDVVFRGCSSELHNDGCWADYVQVDGNADTKRTAVSCSKTCASDGCNSNSLPFSNMQGSGLLCQSCLSEHGGCVSYKVEACQAGMEYCYSKVIYTDGQYYNAIGEKDAVEIIYEERGCRATPLTRGGSCTTLNTNIAGSNIDVIQCDETCVGDNCNDGWPQRPKCLICSGSYFDGTGAVIPENTAGHWEFCALKPPPMQRCDDPSYKYCYANQEVVPDGDMEVKWGFSKVFTRGCLKEAAGSKCWDRHYRDEKEAKECQWVCAGDGCNQGSSATGLVATGLTLLVPAVLARLC